MDPSDSIRICCYHFPTGAITATWLVANMIVNNSGGCSSGQKGMLVAVIIIFACLLGLNRLTDTYVASDGMPYTVVLVPFYGALCPHLPTLEDKDTVYANYRLRWSDYWRAICAMLCHALISFLCSPVPGCLFGDCCDSNGNPYNDSTSKLPATITIAAPIYITLIAAILFTCLPPDRQMVGHANVPSTQLLPTADPVLQALNPTYRDDERDEGELDEEGGVGRSDGSLEEGMGRRSRVGGESSYVA